MINPPMMPKLLACGMINMRVERIMIAPMRVHIDLFGCIVKSDNVPPTKPIIAPLAPTETLVGMNKAEN